MKSQILFLSALFFGATVLFSSCKKDEPHNHEPGTLTLKMDNKWLDNDFALGTEYTTSEGDKITVNQLRYYISNLRLVAEDGSEWVHPESYHLCDMGVDGSERFVIPNVAAGKYKSVKFMLGVDSTRNVSGAQEGALDPAKGMFWSWNTGYIFFRLEGEILNNPAEPAGIRMHLGGFREPNVATREVSYDFDLSSINDESSLMLHFYLQLDKVFEGLTTEDYERVHMPGAKAMRAMDNVAAALKFDHIH